ncbi:MAG: CotH kinase family protein [Bacteroidetes bacterium]|nr:CotH kinase family protein [Bacteroidota bacterium]
MDRTVFVSVILLFFYHGICTSQHSSLTLPVFRLEVDSVYLNVLDADPHRDEYVPAVFSAQGESYDCEVRYRGGSTRTLPKKSWKIRFPDDDNIFGVKKLNLNAEYRDRSLMRNHLAMSLFRFLGMPAPRTEHVNLFVNNRSMGVFLNIEEVDRRFLARHDREEGNLYQGINHSASMAPLLRSPDLLISWEKEEGVPGDYRDAQRFFAELWYWSRDEFQARIGQTVDLANILDYFAAAFFMSSYDCFTKNLYLYENPESGRYEIFPWDNDATFGVNWLGEYHSNWEKFTLSGAAANQLLLQRLLERHKWQEAFRQRIGHILTQGEPFLEEEILRTATRIRNDVYLDTAKCCSNEEFEDGIRELFTFLRSRVAFLEETPVSPRISLSDFSCSNPFPGADDTLVIFRVRSELPQEVFVRYIPDLDLTAFAAPHDTLSIPLYDDGRHEDGDAGDGVYANTASFGHCRKGLIPYCFVGTESYYPANGLHYINFVPTHFLALNTAEEARSIETRLRIGNVFRRGRLMNLALFNSSECALDISGCRLCGRGTEDIFMLPDGTKLPPGDTLILTNDVDLAGRYFPEAVVIGSLFFDIAAGDTIRILSPSLTPLIEEVCDSVHPLGDELPSVVINEINYHSSDDFNPEDWIELHYPGTISADLSGWQVKDGRDDHIFILPEGTELQPAGFLVICQDRAAFQQYFPYVQDILGDMDFGLDAGGEMVRLYSAEGILVDSVAYDDDPPWPVEADGGGSSLELIDPFVDNTLPQNWMTGSTHGTPGAMNDPGIVVRMESRDRTTHRLYQNHPNPFTGSTMVRFDIARSCPVTLKIFDMLGRKRAVPVDAKLETGTHTIRLSVGHLPPGSYMYALSVESDVVAVRMMHILH